MILCARSMSRSREQSTKRRTSERFAYSIVKITRLYDYQTWQTNFLRNSRGAQRFVDSCFLIVLLGCWLAGQENPTATENRFSPVRRSSFHCFVLVFWFWFFLCRITVRTCCSMLYSCTASKHKTRGMETMIYQTPMLSLPLARWVIRITDEPHSHSLPFLV